MEDLRSIFLKFRFTVFVCCITCFVYFELNTLDLCSFLLGQALYRLLGVYMLSCHECLLLTLMVHVLKYSFSGLSLDVDLSFFFVSVVGEKWGC